MSSEETFRRVLAARLPAGPGWTAWIDGTVAELAGSAPPQGIDRDEVIALVEQLGLEVAAIVRGLGPPLLDPVIWADRIIALLQPVEVS